MGFRILGRSWPRNFRIGTGFERQFSNPAKPDGATTESNFWPPVFDFSYAIPLPTRGRWNRGANVEFLVPSRGRWNDGANVEFFFSSREWVRIADNAA